VAAVPMPGPAESLNVAAAAAVCLFERVRQLGQRRES
jgi:TrmH family RNA methyltransferase